MPIYNRSEFENANSALSVLEQDISDAKNLMMSIKTYKRTSYASLSGQSWDLVRNSLENYVEALNTRINNCKALMNGIKGTNNTMIGALDNNDVNTDKLEELKATYNRCIALTEDSNEELSEKAQTDNLKLLQETNAMIEQIEKVQRAEQSAINQLNQLLDNNSSYLAQVNNIIPSSIIHSEQI